MAGAVNVDAGVGLGLRGFGKGEAVEGREIRIGTWRVIFSRDDVHSELPVYTFAERGEDQGLDFSIAEHVLIGRLIGLSAQYAGRVVSAGYVRDEVNRLFAAYEREMRS